MTISLASVVEPIGQKANGLKDVNSVEGERLKSLAFFVMEDAEQNGCVP